MNFKEAWPNVHFLITTQSTNNRNKKPARFWNGHNEQFSSENEDNFDDVPLERQKIYSVKLHFQNFMLGTMERKKKTNHFFFLPSLNKVCKTSFFISNNFIIFICVSFSLTIFPFVQSSSIFIQIKTCTNTSFNFK